MASQDMRERIASAVRDDDEGTAEAEAPSPDLNDPGDDSPGDKSEGSAGGTATSEDAPAGDVTEVPTEYFGYEFPPDLSSEERGELIAEFKKRDDQIGKLLRERVDEATGDETQPEVETAEPIPELTDVEILQALNLDPDNNPFDEATAKLAIPLIRRQVQQEQTIASLVENLELTQIDRTWRASLEGLEKKHGALPPELDHEAVMEFAAENNIGSPTDAYWRLVGPGRASLEEATRGLQARRTAAKQAASGTRPGTTAADDEAPVVGKTTKAATKEVATRLLRDLGLS